MVLSPGSKSAYCAFNSSTVFWNGANATVWEPIEELTKMNLPEPQSVPFSSLMGDIEKGTVKIPQFQRDFVWNREKSAKLLDSIVKGYPIGTFILWKTKEELRALRSLGGLDLPPPPAGDFIHYVLDGQQRLTTLFAAVKGLKITRDDGESEDYSEFYIDLQAAEDEPIVLTALADTDRHKLIKLHDLLYGKLKQLSAYPERVQDKIQQYKDRINAYHFSSVLIKEAPIDVATEIFTRLNVGGVQLSVFEIMVAKTFDSKRNFDLAEQMGLLKGDLGVVDYETLPESVILQTVSILILKECRKKDILGISRTSIIDIWEPAIDAIKETVEYFRNTYRIPVSKLLPYPNLIVPFTYYFFKTNRKPTGDQSKFLQDFFWRASLGGRYSQSVESRLAQDVRRIDSIIDGQLPKYDWAVDTSAKFLAENGKFSVSRAYIKAILCVLAFKEPKSFNDNAIVRISNDWLKQANSKNYHHFFPRAYLTKAGWDDSYINHIANITIVDDFLNKREMRDRAPSKYMTQFDKENERLSECMKSHLISLDDSIWNDDYEVFFTSRCKALTKELKKRIIDRPVDHSSPAAAASDTESDSE
jgi:hypothetical protein